jgi:hypothetical protein
MPACDPARSGIAKKTKDFIKYGVFCHSYPLRRIRARILYANQILKILAEW